MRLEQIPVLIGVVVAILGLGLVLDGQLPDGVVPSRERRRRARTERHRGGETLVGLGVISVAAALIGRDTWRFGTLAVLGGAVLLALGAWLNRDYLRELFLFRGPARRGEKRHAPRGNATARAGAGSAAAVTTTPIAPGLADVAPRRTPALRTDREAPIMTATEGVPRDGGGAVDDEPGPDGQPRLRIR
jgi:hypothetical protein